MRISTNVSALNTHRVLAAADRTAGRSMERLASGLRINRAADDAAGLAISEGLRSQMGGMRQAERNTQDGVSVVRTAEGALTETASILRRMRDLAVQAANHGAVDPAAREAVQQEIDQLAAEVTRIARVTTFNGTPLLDGSYRGTFQVGPQAGETITLGIGGASGGLDADGLRLTGIDVTRTGAGHAGTVSNAPAVSDAEGVPTSSRLAFPGDYTSDATAADLYGALAGTITYEGRSLDLARVDYTGAVTAHDHLSRLTSAALTALGTSFIPVVAASSGLIWTGENPGTGSTVADARRLSWGYSAGDTGAIRTVDAAIRRVSAVRADLGAFENRLQHTAARLAVSVENATASWSRIRDTDMAAEMIALTRAQVLAQAGTAMLAQAQRTPQGVLRLLG